MKPQLSHNIVKERTRQAWDMLEACTLCPRACSAARLQSERGDCQIGARAIVSSAFPHHGEEKCLRGFAGSGTIFFSGCNLHCIYCQNHEISQDVEGHEVNTEEIALMMLELQRSGCHNVNWVTPTHVIPYVLDALAIALENGFNLPIVYNSGGYDAVPTLKLLDGIVNIYMPDFKYWDSATAERLSDAPDYPEVACAALKEMHRQVGDLTLDDRGIATRGLLVRHLVLPDGLAGTKEIVRFIYNEISPNTAINIMGQYHPHWKAHQVQTLRRPVHMSEVTEARRLARDLNIL